MFGFFIGIASLVGLYYVLSERGACGRRGPFGSRRWGMEGRHGRRFGGRGLGGFMHRIFDTLDTTAGQEKEIRSAVDELWSEARALRSELHDSRADVARALRGEYFDETTMGELFAKHDAVLDKLRRALVGALARVHAVLDSGQRTRLAELIDRGLGRWSDRAWNS